MFIVYVLVLENKRIYVGMTPSWREDIRFLEHMNPDIYTTKWTSKYQTIEKCWISKKIESKIETTRLEHTITKQLMREYGLDVVRGGDYVMTSENNNWWVPKDLQNTKQFSDIWKSYSPTQFLKNLKNHSFLKSINPS